MSNHDFLAYKLDTICWLSPKKPRPVSGVHVYLRITITSIRKKLWWQYLPPT